MNIRSMAALALFVLTLAACTAEEKKPLTVGESKDFGSVCDKANDGKRVAIEGYLRFPDEVTVKNSVVLRLYPTNEFNGQPVGVSSFPFGTGPHHLAMIPKNYMDSDLKLTTADGQVAPYRTKVKVSGDVYYPTVGQTFQCALSNPLVELAK